jgi:hypothetical protein
MLSLKNLQEEAKQYYPSLKVTHIVTPTRRGRPIIFWGDGKANLVRPRANFVALDPYSGKVLQVHSGTQLDWYQLRIQLVNATLLFLTKEQEYCK